MSLVIVIAEMLISDEIGVFDSNLTLLVLTLILISCTSISRLFRGIIIASIETKVLATAILFSTTAKFAITFALLSLGLNEIGLTTGIVSFTVLQSVLLAPSIVRTLGKASLDKLSDISLKTSSLALLKGGIPNWIPNLITALGAQLGTIIIFGSTGAIQAGFYFVVSIHLFRDPNRNVCFVLYYDPVLSSLNEGKERLTNRTIKMSLLSSVPLSYSMIFFTDEIMSIFGPSYVDASFALQILLSSIMPVAITTGITNHIYASGNYRHTLITGISSSVPRVVLYFIFVPMLGNTGAAISFTIGSFIGLFTSVVVAADSKVSINWKEALFVCIIPLALSYLFSFTDINFGVCILLTLAFSYILLLKIRIMTFDDIHDALLILPKKVASPILKAIDFVGRKLDKSY